MLVLLGAGAGLLLTGFPAVGPAAGRLVLPALMGLLVGVFLHLSPGELAGVRAHARVVWASLAVNFLVTPLLAWVLGVMLLPGRPELRLGLLMLLLTPCTDWYLVFTSLARGNVALATALLPVNLGLQLVLLPAYVLLFAGALVPVDPGVLVEAVGLVLLVPLGLAAGARTLLVRARGPAWFARTVLARTGPVQLGLLVVAVAGMFAWQGEQLWVQPWATLGLLPPLAVFFAASFGLAQALARGLGVGYGERATLTMTTMARNSPIALALAVAAFGEQPLIALALVVAPLVELPVLALAVRLLRRAQPVP